MQWFADETFFMLAEIWKGTVVGETSDLSGCAVEFAPNVCSGTETSDLKRHIEICYASTVCFVCGSKSKTSYPRQEVNIGRRMTRHILTPEQLTRITQ